MVTTEESPNRRLARVAVKLVIGVVALLILQAIISNLSALNQPVPLGTSYITYATLARAAVQTAIFVLLIRFGRELGPAIGVLLPTVPEIGRIIQFGVWLIPVALAYAAYADLAEALLGSSIMWLYQLTFALIAGGLLLATGALIFKNLDPLTDLVVHQLPRHLPRWPTSTPCRSCGAGVPSAAQFCPACGNSVTGTSPRPVATPPSDLHCPKCQATAAKEWLVEREAEAVAAEVVAINATAITYHGRTDVVRRGASAAARGPGVFFAA